MSVNKQLTVLAIVGILAVSAVGIGFAYSATTQNTDNTVETSYLKLRSYNSDASATKYSESFDLSGANLIYWNTVTDMLKIGEATEASEKIKWTLSTAAGENGHVAKDDDKGKKLILKGDATDPGLDEGQAALTLGSVILEVTKNTASDKYSFSIADDIPIQSDKPYKVFACVSKADEISATTWTKVDFKAISDDAASAAAIVFGTNLDSGALKVELFAVYDGYVTESTDASPVAINAIVTDGDKDLALTFTNVTVSFTAEATTSS